MRYNIKYQHVGGDQELKDLSLFEFVQRINELEEDPFVIKSTIEVESIKPHLPSKPPLKRNLKAFNKNK